jgi:hypothetical protein
MTENDIQRAIVEYLNAVLFPTHRVFAIPNAARRGKGGHATNGVPGLRAGVPDLQIVGRGRVYFIEVKRDANARLSPAQDEFAEWCVCTGVPWVRAESVDHVRQALIQWGIITREHVA